MPSLIPIVFTAGTFLGAMAHHTHHSHAMRGLAMDMSSMDMSGSTMNMSSSSTSDESFKCPVCGMSTTDFGYDDLNHVDFMHGQTVYTCGMAARSFDSYSFDVTDTSYLAANVAEFIVNSTDSTDYAKCEKSCDECSNNIKDPVTGDLVTTSNYQYVCLKNGQKIYFSSTTSKNKYLSNVNSEPRYLVDNVICKGSKCSDADKITVLSAAAKAFVADTSSSSSGDSTTVSSAVALKSPAKVAFTVLSVLAIMASMA